MAGSHTRKGAFRPPSIPLWGTLIMCSVVVEAHRVFATVPTEVGLPGHGSDRPGRNHHQQDASRCLAGVRRYPRHEFRQFRAGLSQPGVPVPGRHHGAGKYLCHVCNTPVKGFLAALAAADPDPLHDPDLGSEAEYLSKQAGAGKPGVLCPGPDAVDRFPWPGFFRHLVARCPGQGTGKDLQV